jgi:hypothetical protein
MRTAAHSVADTTSDIPWKAAIQLRWYGKSRIRQSASAVTIAIPAHAAIHWRLSPRSVAFAFSSFKS